MHLHWVCGGFAPIEAIGKIQSPIVWTLHDIPDVWDEKVTNDGPHAKPVGLQGRLIEALTNTRDIVIDPAAGSYSVLKACQRTNRRFLGCDIEG